ncbi:MAG: hypothetical protein ACREF7_04210 [Candidatus Saccharimonadales bacterium]
MIGSVIIRLVASACSGSQLSSGTSDNACYNTDLPTVAASSSELQTILQILFGIIGALAVLFIVIGGFSYVASNGNSQAMQKARSTIMYAVVGLLVAIFAEAIVTFVIGNL